MNKNQINSLYQLIKQQSQKKGRPLKIICDWDECLGPYRPFAIYNFGQKRGLWLKVSFKEFFKDFWEKASVKTSDGSSANKEVNYFGENEEEKLLIEDFMKLLNERREGRKKGIDKHPGLDSLSDSPFLDFADHLLSALKENLISELTIISTTRATSGKISSSEKFKQETFAKSFANLPQCNLSMIRVQRINGKNKPHRWEWIKENHPDFDMFIDDDKGWIKSVRERFGPEKTYVVNDYKYSRDLQADNIYHVKTDVSDLKDQDFAISALELKTKKLEQQLASTKQERERERERTKMYWIVGGGIMILALGVLLVLTWKKKKIQKKSTKKV